MSVIHDVTDNSNNMFSSVLWMELILIVVLFWYKALELKTNPFGLCFTLNQTIVFFRLTLNQLKLNKEVKKCLRRPVQTGSFTVCEKREHKGTLEKARAQKLWVWRGSGEKTHFYIKHMLLWKVQLILINISCVCSPSLSLRLYDFRSTRLQ